MKRVKTGSVSGWMVLATVACLSCLLVGCDRMSAVTALVPPTVVDGGDPAGGLEKLAQQEPGATAPLIAYFDGRFYVNTSGIQLVWVNPTDRPWYIAPGSERFTLKKKRFAHSDSESAPIIGTRVQWGKEAQARVVSQGTEMMGKRGPLDMPEPVELDDRTMVWPQITNKIAAGAELVPMDKNLVLPAHSRGFLRCVFAAFGYSSAEFSLQLTDGERVTNFSRALEFGEPRLFGGGWWPMPPEDLAKP